MQNKKNKDYIFLCGRIGFVGANISFLSVCSGKFNWAKISKTDNYICVYISKKHKAITIIAGWTASSFFVLMPLPANKCKTI